jgi:hypothetical protein
VKLFQSRGGTFLPPELAEIEALLPASTRLNVSIMHRAEAKKRPVMRKHWQSLPTA